MSGDETRRLHPRAALDATVTAATDVGIARTVETTDDGGGPPAAPVPAAMGRYRIVRRIGAGGMGVVYEGHDPQLDRPVAIKVLHERVRARAHLAERLHREARALARVTHANVVSVHDVGVEDGEVYVVMQYVDGETLDRALAGKRGDRDAILACFDAAGRGLAAAHAAELVHRDFKPGNVLVDAAGHVRVTDFGLARVSDLAEAPDGGSGDLGVSMTRGELVGTPAYMAPEQFRGGPITAAADQFSFCVALWEALCGARPFAGDSIDTIRDAVLAGVVAAPREGGLPRRLERVLRRGLAVDPAARFPSMTALLDALAPPRTVRTIGIAAAGAGAIAIAIVATKALSSPGAPAKESPRPLASGPAAAPERLTRLGGCAYSPAFIDDDTVTFDLTRDGAVDLYRLELGAAAPVRLTSEVGWEWRSAPGAPGEVIYIRQGGAVDGVEIYQLATGARRLLTTLGGPAVFARDHYFYAPANSGEIRRRRGERDEIFTAALHGKNVDSLVASGDGARISIVLQDRQKSASVCTTATDRPELACLPITLRGSRPAFSSDGAALYVDGGGRIDRAALAGGELATVVPDAQSAGGLAVAPGGGALVFSDCRQHSDVYDLVADARAGLGDGDAGHPAIGPGGVLAYVRTRGDRVSLMVRGPAGEAEELVARDQGRISSIAFSADGRQLAYVLSGTDEPGLYLVTISARAKPNRLTEDPADERPVFAGDRVAFTRRTADGTARFMTVATDGSGAQPAGGRPRLAIGVDHGRGRVLLAAPTHEHLYWWDPATGAESPGPPTPWDYIPTHVALAPDGHWLLVLGGNNGQDVWRVRLSDGVRERVHQLPGDVTALLGAIDDRGHPWVAVDGWTGDLWIAKPPAGARW